MVFVIVLGLIILIGVVVLFASMGGSNEKSKQIQAEHRKRVARQTVKSSNENLSKYIEFVAENEPIYGKPDKILGLKEVKGMTFLRLADDDGNTEGKAETFSNTMGIGCETISINKENMLAEIFSKAFPSVENMVVVYGDAKMIALKGKLYEFSDVLSYEVQDNSNQILIGGKVESTTQTNTGSMVGRGVVGGLIGGTTGAIIGASTASKSTTTKMPNQRVVTKHDYSVYISVRDLANPMIKFNYGNDADAVQEFVAVLNIVIS